MRKGKHSNMRENDFAGAVSGIPAGLIACRLNGRGVHIARIAKNALWLRFSDMEKAEGTLEVCFRQMNGNLHIVTIQDYQTGEAHRDPCGVLLRFSFENAGFAREYHRAMAFYADYVRAFAEEDLSAFLKDNPQSSADPSFDFSSLPAHMELCISLQEPELYDLFLNHSMPDFLRIYAAEKQIHGLGQIRRLYIGNGFCRQLFPDAETLRRLLARAKENGLAVTLVTAPDPRLSDAFLSSYSGEILVNDWGLLYQLQKHSRILPILGTLLNKRRKDPRMLQKPDLHPELLRQNSLNSPDYRAFLAQMGVNRWEFEHCGYDFDLPEGHCSLHLPCYQTNTSVYCPLRAICVHGDRARQSDDDGCPRYCQSQRLIYPDSAGVFARWNSLFSVDARPPDNLSVFDRIVLNL